MEFYGVAHAHVMIDLRWISMTVIGLLVMLAVSQAFDRASGPDQQAAGCGRVHNHRLKVCQDSLEVAPQAP